MRIVMAYAGVVLIWATTPLGIKWSNSTLHFTAAVGLRMSLAFVLCIFILAFRGQALFQSKKDWQVYLAGALCLFPTMVIVYWSAQYISSGMISVVFGIYPFFVGVLSRLFIAEAKFTRQQMLSLGIAIFGLCLIQFEQVQLGKMAAYGIVAVVASTLIFAAATLWMKQIGGNVDPFRQNTGVLLFALPGFIAFWYLSGAPAPEALDRKSIIGVAYLVVGGSVIGATLFFYVLHKCTVVTTSLIPLMTPLLAMIIGVVLDGESISGLEITGAILIVLSLGVYQGVSSGFSALISWIGLFRKRRSDEGGRSTQDNVLGSSD